MRRVTKIIPILLCAIIIGQNSDACMCLNIWPIDSLPQLKEYSFIAHVKITEDGYFKNPTKSDNETIGLLKFEVLEVFKGEKINQLLEYSKNTSCDIGISKGEEWVLFGILIDGKMAVIACDRNQRYREKNGLRDWKYGGGFYEIKQLRKLYEHPEVKYENETRKEFYSTGKPEIEETYKHGKPDGYRKIWYPNGQIFCKLFYINDTLDAKSEWFYESGQAYYEDYYIKGKRCNISRIYYDSAIEHGWKNSLIEIFYKTEDSLKFVYHRVQPQYETVFDSYGRAIIAREFTRLGKIHKEETIDPERHFSIVIYYHDN